MKAVYIRVSTDKQDADTQLRDIESISGKDYVLFQDYQSAWKEDKERENFERLIKEIKSKKVSDVFVWDLDRLYRNREKLMGFFELCKAFSCTIWSFRQKFINEMQSIVLPKGFEFIKDMYINNFIQFLGWIAEDESNKKSDRVRKAQRIIDGVVYSYKGNKWGRKNLSTQKRNKIIELKDLPIRKIAADVGCSVGVVHKVLQDLKAQNSFNKESVHN